MRKVKFVAIFLCAAVSCVSLLAGCLSGGAPAAASSKAAAQKNATPEEAAASYFAAAQRYDKATVQAHSVNEMPGSSELSSSSAVDPSEEEIDQAIFQKLEALLENKAQINGDKASIKVKITAPDMKKIMGDVVAAAFSQALASAFSSSGVDSADMTAEMTNEMKSDLAKPDVALVSTEMNLQLVKKNGRWLVEVTDNLTDAMTGGLFSFGKDLSAAFDSATTAA